MTTTTTSVRPRGSRRISLEWVAPAILVLAALALIISVTRSSPDRASVGLVNRSPATVTVAVSGNARDGWLPIATVDPKSREQAEAVIDPGGVWRFRLTVGPDQVAEIRRTADQLRAAGWTFTIPTDVADNLPVARRT
jgi:hypothetical protein